MQENLYKEIKRLAVSYVKNTKHNEEIDRGVVRQLHALAFQHSESMIKVKQVFWLEVDNLQE